MADNTEVSSGTGVPVATDKVTYSGDADQNVQLMRPVLVTGAEGSKTVVDLPGDNTNGLDVDVTRVPTDPFGANADAASVSGSISAKLRQIATNGHPVAGDVAHDGGDSGNPVKVGAVAVAHGTNPTAVAAADRTNLYANRAGIPFALGGHPNIVSAEYITTGAQTDDPVVAVVSAGTKIVVTQISVIASAANTVSPAVRIGFGTASVPAQGASGADGVAKVILSHPGVPAGSGLVKGNGAGIVGIGGDGEDLRITCGAPTTGSLVVQVDFFTIES